MAINRNAQEGPVQAVGTKLLSDWSKFDSGILCRIAVDPSTRHDGEASSLPKPVVAGRLDRRHE